MRRSTRFRPSQPGSVPKPLAPAVPMPSLTLPRRKRMAWVLGGFSFLGVLILAGWLVMSQPWSPYAQTAEPAETAAPTGSEFAAERFPEVPRAIKGDRTMTYLKEICKIGPRMSGTEGMKKQQELIQKHFENLGAKVEYQRFQGKQRSRKDKVEMANMVVSWFPDQQRRVILCSHYDTRPIADQERDERRWHDPFVSANDGGSGVALLMELGHQMKDLKTNVGVDFVLFDGEEYVFSRDDDYFFGSKHFGTEYAKGNRGKVRYSAAILLDMIAGKNAVFPVEQNSWWKASPLVNEVWRIAAELKCPAFKLNAFSAVAVEDDHIPLNRAGIPAIDIIDFEYPHWHRLTDTPENCSTESMDQVARVLLLWLQRTK